MHSFLGGVIRGLLDLPTPSLETWAKLITDCERLVASLPHPQIVTILAIEEMSPLPIPDTNWAPIGTRA